MHRIDILEHGHNPPSWPPSLLGLALVLLWTQVLTLAIGRAILHGSMRSFLPLCRGLILEFKNSLALVTMLRPKTSP